MTNVTCGLTAKKLGSAPCPTLVFEHGTTLLHFKPEVNWRACAYTTSDVTGHRTWSSLSYVIYIPNLRKIREKPRSLSWTNGIANRQTYTHAHTHTLKRFYIYTHPHFECTFCSCMILTSIGAILGAKKAIARASCQRGPGLLYKK